MRWAGVLLVILVACSQQAAPSGATASAPRTANQPRVQAGFSCTLPVSTPERRGAFVSFPSGDVKLDARTRDVLFYDRPYARWLPVGRQAVSPDGSRYAVVEGQAIRIVDLAGGADRRFALPGPPGGGPWVVVDFATEGVYLGVGGTRLVGLWLLSGGGAVTRVAQLSGFQFHGTEREFWVPGGQPGQVDRLDLSDGYRETWFYRPGADTRVVGVDRQDHPIVVAGNGNSTEVLRLLAPGRQEPLFTGSADFVGGLGSPESDNRGIWFGSERGVYLYSDSAGFQKVSDQPGYPAGFCL